MCRVTKFNIAPGIKSALADNQAVIITGRSMDERLNAHIGKSEAVFSEVVPLLKEQGLQTRYINLGEGLYFVREKAFFVYLQRNIVNGNNSLMNADMPVDIFIMDEAQHLFGPLFHPAYRMFVRDHSAKTWGIIDRKAKEGKKFIFITRMHPYCKDFCECEFFEETSVFFQAPIMEFCLTGFRLRTLQLMRRVFPWIRLIES